MGWIEDISQENKDFARAAYRKGELSLFVGAGVSKSCGLPLLQELAEKVVEVAYPENNAFSIESVRAQRAAILRHDARTAIRLARERLGRDFPRTLYAALYGTRVDLQPSVSVMAITELEKVTKICCTNYDNVMELGYLQAASNRAGGERLFTTVTPKEKFNHPQNGAIICHPHGFLPFIREGFQENPAQTGAMDIIVTDDDYYREFLQPYSWTNLIQIQLFLTTSVLFVGCSLTDPDTLRLLFLAKMLGCPRKHFSIRIDSISEKGHPNQRTDEVEAVIRADTQLLRNRGVHPIWYKNKDHNEVPDILRYLKE